MDRGGGHRGSRHQQQQMMASSVNQQQYLHQQFDPSAPYVECYNGGNYAEEDNERSVDDDEELDDGYPGDEDHFVVVNAMVMGENECWNFRMRERERESEKEFTVQQVVGMELFISLLMLEILDLKWVNILLLAV